MLYIYIYMYTYCSVEMYLWSVYFHCFGSNGMKPVYDDVDSHKTVKKMHNLVKLRTVVVDIACFANPDRWKNHGYKSPDHIRLSDIQMFFR